MAVEKLGILVCRLPKENLRRFCGFCYWFYSVSGPVFHLTVMRRLGIKTTEGKITLTENSIYKDSQFTKFSLKRKMGGYRKKVFSGLSFGHVAWQTERSIWDWGCISFF